MEELEEILLQEDTMSSADIKSMISKRIEKADNKTLEVILYQLKEELIDSMLKKLAERSKGALLSDLPYISDIIRRLPGSVIEKIKFLKGCVEGSHLDFGSVVRDSKNKKVLISDYIKDPMAMQFWKATAIKNPKFNLGDATSVGPGEGSIICLAKDTGKALKGDISYKNVDIEIKGQGARWGSARVKTNNPSMFQEILFNALTKKYNKLKSPLNDNWPEKYLSTIEKYIKDNKISYKDFNSAMGEAFNYVYPNVSGSLRYFNSNTSMFSNGGVEYAAAYTAVIAEYYKNADGWESLMHFNHLKPSFPTISFSSYKEAYDLVKSKKLWPGIWAPGGSDARSANSPTYSIPA